MRVTDLSTLSAGYTAKNEEILTGTLGANVKISIADGATVTIRDVTIDGKAMQRYSWAGLTCEGNATIILEGKNTVKGFLQDYPGIFVPAGKTLTIKGDGSLTASSNGYGAGIGGVYNGSCGNIVIESGIINAQGGYYAEGIGGGYYADCGNITINNGTITATGGKYAAGIGSGLDGSCGNITITGGTITATGGKEGAGIGGGDRAKCGNITIIPLTVTAINGTDAECSIGRGKGSRCGTVNIRGTVGEISDSPYTCINTLDLAMLFVDYTAQDGEILSGKLGANVRIAIADGATVTLKDAIIYSNREGLTCAGDATIILEGTNFTQGNDYYSGVYIPAGKTLTIKGDGSLTANGGYLGAAGIGASYHIACGNIVIEGGTITARGGRESAAIGGAYDASCGNITITDNVTRIIAIKGDWALYSIGAGVYGKCGTITIGGKGKASIPDTTYTYEP